MCLTYTRRRQNSTVIRIQTKMELKHILINRRPSPVGSLFCYLPLLLPMECTLYCTKYSQVLTSIPPDFYCIGPNSLLVKLHRYQLSYTRDKFGPIPLQLCGKCWLFTKFTQRWKYSFSINNLQLPCLWKAKKKHFSPYENCSCKAKTQNQVIFH